MVRSSNTKQATTVEIPLSAPDRGNTSASSEPFERSRDRRATDGQH